VYDDVDTHQCRSSLAAPHVPTRRSTPMIARVVARDVTSRSIAPRAPRALSSTTRGRDGRRRLRRASTSRASPRALDDGARGGWGGFGAGGGDDGSPPWSRVGGGGDGGDDDDEDGSRRFNARVKFFVGAVVLHWTTTRAIAWNDRAVYDDDDTDEEWSRKRVSIVIPARNESKAIGAVLRRVSLALEPEAAEIIVSVGDSSDDTADIARSHGAIVVSGEKGRGNQMNAGARVATGDYILFLHADTTPPADVVDVIRRQLRDQKTVIGGFVSLIETPTRTFWGMSYHNVVKTTYCAVVSRPLAYLTGFRILFGDQAMFVRRDDFENVGGFDGSLSIMEDADLCVRMWRRGRGKHKGRVKLLDRVVTTSGRRIEPLGNFRATCIHVLIACSWNFGVKGDALRKLYDWCYRDVR